MGSRPNRPCLKMAYSMTLWYHQPLHPVSQHHRLYLSLCIVRSRLPHLLSHCLSRLQRTHMHIWIDLSRGWGSWGLQTKLLLGRILMDSGQFIGQVCFVLILIFFIRLPSLIGNSNKFLQERSQENQGTFLKGIERNVMNISRNK